MVTTILSLDSRYAEILKTFLINSIYYALKHYLISLYDI